MKKLSFLIVCFFISCSRNNDIKFAEIIKFNNNGEYSLERAELKNILDLKTLKGKNVQIMASMKIYQEDLLREVDTCDSFDDLKVRMGQKMGGEEVSPNFNIEDGVLKSLDFESQLMLNAYYHLDQILDFFSWNERLKVGIYGQMMSKKESNVPIVTYDNALYILGTNAIFLLRVGDQNGLPLGMHPGVLAHEFFHWLFFESIWNNPKFPNLWSKWQSLQSSKESNKSIREKIILNAIDEGLADLFAVAFSSQPSYLSISLLNKNDKKIAIQRDLNGEFAENATYDNLSDSFFDNNLKQLCHDHAFGYQNDRFNYYCLGTVLAKSIFDAANKDTVFLKTLIQTIIRQALNDIAEALSENKNIDMDIFLEGLAYRASLTNLNFFNNLCMEVKNRFYSLYNARRIPSCI